MKKSLLILGLAVTLFACNKEQSASGSMKTAYIDTIKLMEEYEELKEWESKGNVKKEQMELELKDEARKLDLDKASFQNEAQAKGQRWAEMRYQELQERQMKLGMKQETMIRELQEEFGTQRDTIVSQMKKFIKDYGKKEGYDYIYGTGDAASVLYAKDQYNITADVIKQLNDKFNGGSTEAKEEEPAKETADTTAATK